VTERIFDINAGVALRVDDGGDAAGPDQVGSVRQASEIELLEVHASMFRV